MPVCVKRESIKVENITDGRVISSDMGGTEFNLPVYNVFVFRKPIPILLFFLANGFEYTMTYLGVDNVITFLTNVDEMDMDRYLYFQISSKLFIRVEKEIFLKYPYIQNIVGSFLEVCTNRITMKDLYDKDIWIKRLSANNTLEKGQDILVFFNRLLDETTKKILKLDEYNKRDIYSILKWMMENFNTLRQKDNLSLDNKRLRCNEYIASLLTMEFSTRLNRIIANGPKATIDNYLDLFRFSGNASVKNFAA